ncbi:hypothetical protein [Lentzea sp. NEAU-D7]|nr:hypothetical protein [Lentzea sp. NEAU-D7]MCX2948942.1 hypothetical protein [Lentzea sp. NEAU-D7]
MPDLEHRPTRSLPGGLRLEVLLDEMWTARRDRLHPAQSRRADSG